MSFDFFCQAAGCYGLEVDREKLAGFERFYNNFYDGICEITQKLYNISQGKPANGEAESAQAAGE
ncbi:MAG: hypothetical protein K2N47_04780 [Clostridia bacterium]|nr:hypothetical protein [Clostridia bacterium]